jgi:hypothetical protein
VNEPRASKLYFRGPTRAWAAFHDAEAYSGAFPGFSPHFWGATPPFTGGLRCPL